jgi:3-oxoadipate enol-lactonase
MDSTTPVILLHAFPLNAAMWKPQIPAAGDRTMLTPDFPGFGGRPVTEADLDRFAETIIKDMAPAGISRAVIVGLSMGGYVAFRLHALAPERVAGLVLADTRAEADDEAGQAVRTEQAARARREGVGWLSETLIPSLLGETTARDRPGVVDTVRGMMEEADREGVARALEAMRDRPDSTPVLKEINVPTLVLVGAEDTLTPESKARAMADQIPRARLEVLPDAGHLSNLEAPRRFNEALGAFLG